MRPAERRSRRFFGGRSISSMLSAERSTLSGTVSRCSLFVMDRTTSFSDSICCTLMVVMTSMPASSRSTTSCQRFSCVHPGMFVWASSSTRATCGRRAMTANRSISLNHMPRYFMQRRGTVSRPLAAFCVALRPWVSNRAMTTSLPSSTSRLPSDSIAYVLPTPGAHRAEPSAHPASSPPYSLHFEVPPHVIRSVASSRTDAAPPRTTMPHPSGMSFIYGLSHLA